MSWEVVVAYCAGLFLVGGVGSMIGGLIGFGSMLYRHAFWSWAAGFSSSVLAYLIGRSVFSWLDVEFTWYAYLLCMIAVIFNDGRRAASEAIDVFGPEKQQAFGTFSGIVASLLYF